MLSARGYALWCCTVLLAAIHLGCNADPNVEPRYKGKKLSQWIEGEASKDPDQIAEALRSTGTNAFPHLIRWIADGQDHALAATDAFEHYGSSAAPAVPELARLLASTNRLSATLAGTALGYIGLPALPALMTAYTNRVFRVGTEAALALIELGTNARPAIPLLLRDLQHYDHYYRERAADTLGKLRLEPETVMPALTNLLTDIYPDARSIALLRLAGFGPQSRQVAPLLSNLLTDTAPKVRLMATNALRQIFPPEAPNRRRP